MEYIGICSKDDSKAITYIDHWIAEAGGSLSLSELEENYLRVFCFFHVVTFDAEDWIKTGYFLFAPYVLFEDKIFKQPGGFLQNVH